MLNKLMNNFCARLVPEDFVNTTHSLPVSAGNLFTFLLHFLIIDEMFSDSFALSMNPNFYSFTIIAKQMSQK